MLITVLWKVGDGSHLKTLHWLQSCGTHGPTGLLQHRGSSDGSHRNQAPDKDISSFLDILGSWTEVSWRVQKECVHWPVYQGHLHRPQDTYAKPEGFPSSQNLRTCRKVSFTEVCFSLLPVQYPGDSSLPRAVLSIVSVLWDPGSRAR